MKKPLFANVPKHDLPRYETSDYLTPGAVERLQDLGEHAVVEYVSRDHQIPMGGGSDPLDILIALEEHGAELSDFLG